MIPYPAKKGGIWRVLWTLWLHWAFPRHFAALHLESLSGLESLRPDPTRPTIFYANHCSWWDGFIAKLVMEDTLGYEGYLPMEEANLRRFPTLTRLGAFGLNRAKPREAMASLRWAEAHIRGGPTRGLWIYPQGNIFPQDLRPLKLERGAAFIASRLGARIVPVACRFEFRDLAKPEVFVLLGKPVIATSPDNELNEEMTLVLTEVVDTLQRSIAADDFDRSRPALTGGRGVDTLWTLIKAPFLKRLPPPAP